MTDQNNNGDNKPFAFESEAQFTETVNKIIGAHVTKRFETFENRLTTKLDESFAKFTPSAKKDDDDKETPERLTLKRVQADLEQVKKERDAAKLANNDKTLRAALNEQFAKTGLPVSAQKLAISHFISEKKAFLDENDNPVFVGEYQGETIPLHEGITNWVKNEGKDLIPQKQGANMRPVRTNPQMQSNTGASEAEQDANIFKLIQERRNLGL